MRTSHSPFSPADREWRKRLRSKRHARCEFEFRFARSRHTPGRPTAKQPGEQDARTHPGNRDRPLLLDCIANRQAAEGSSPAINLGYRRDEMAIFPRGFRGGDAGGGVVGWGRPEKAHPEKKGPDARRKQKGE